ncbi:cbb3-type cytochrome c oxidase subunit I [Thalassobacillus devorans]|uniref:cbb3-type cytochrome c oxidase subunit I n=1 Tax=Thalassobacillus devorans TaxID=279813 RepID=UPI000A1CC475|nr:cbb3-type cytochrome c oxidase subunit I [Thalassobacillus devorans]
MGIKLIKISTIYFLIGVALGYGMSISHIYALSPVHVHINLLGWTALTLAGIVYYLFPNAEKSRLGKWHFWLHNLGLPIMMGSLAVMIVTKNEALGAGTAVGASLVMISVILFTINVWKNVKPKS